MLAEFIGAVIKRNDKYLIEIQDLNENMYAAFPRAEAINAVACKEEILKYCLKDKYGMDICINKSIYEEDFRDNDCVISFGYYDADLLNDVISEGFIWVGEDELDKLTFAFGDNIAVMIITGKEKSREDIMEENRRYFDDRKEAKK
ncbi:MAG: hypothetical protein WCY62_08815 [Clostridia bacterium]|jgi:hypothetical protein